MTKDNERSLGAGTDETGKPLEYIVDPGNADLIEIAKRSGGAVWFNEQEPRVVQWWGVNGLDSMNWVLERGNTRYLNLAVREKPNGNPNQDLSLARIVMGIDYIAILQRDPGKQNHLKGYIATNGSISPVKGPISSLNPLFEQALNSGEQRTGTTDSGITE